MQKYQLLNQMLEDKLAVVIRGDDASTVEETAEACVQGGAKNLEITFTVPGAVGVIEKISEQFRDVLVGAGTVLDSQTARLAILAGAKFIVSPSFDKETAKLCNQYGIPYLPGCMTVNEILNAVQYGSSIVKLFPGSALSPSFIKDIHGPLPHVEIMPTGGVTLDNVNEWLEKGAVMVGVGGEITKPAKNNDFGKVKELTQKFKQKIDEE